MGRSRRTKPKPKAEDEAQNETPAESRPWARAVLIGVVTALFVLRPLYPSESAAAEGDGLPVVMLWLLTLAFWAVLTARGTIARIRFGWPDLAMAGLVFWHSIAALWAVAYESPRPALNMLWEWLGMGIAFFLARQLFETSHQRRAIAAVMIAVAVVVSGYGLYQFCVELPATRESYHQSPDEVLRKSHLWFPPGSPEREAFEQRLESLEPMATFALTNSLAGFLVPWAMVALGISVTLSGGLSIRRRIGIASVLLPIGLCLLLTKSRSAYLASACGGAAIGVTWWIRGNSAFNLRRGMLVAGLAAVLLAVSVVGAVSTGALDREVLSEAPKSLGYRLQYWRSSWAMIQDMPILGCGPGNFQDRYTAYKLPEASEEITDPHNFLIEVWATAGTPALLGLLGILVAIPFCMLRAGRVTTDEVTESNAWEIPMEQADLAAVSVGASAGMLMSLPIGAMSEAPPSWWLPLAGIPVAAAVVVILYPWIVRGADSSKLWLLAGGVLLVHLLFSGGIGFPGVADSLWLLAALALNAVQCGSRLVSSRTGPIVLAGTVVLAGACYVTGYRPTLTSRTLVEKAFASDENSQALLQQAAAADPWGSKPWEYLADLLQQRYMADADEGAFAGFDRAVQEAIRRAPRSASLRHRFGLAYLQCYSLSHSRDQLSKGIALLESAASLYPNECRVRADLAEALLLAGDRIGYEREREKALRLDELTPHLDKKLSDEQRQRLERNRLAPRVRAQPLG